MKLSPHFTLAELTTTQVRDIDNTPPPEAVERLETLALCFLEPLRKHFGPLYVSSGFRCAELNTLIGGAPRSAHLYGCAADLVPLRKGVTPEAMVRWAVAELDCDQAIDEASVSSAWLHLGMARPGDKPRRQALRMRGGKYTRLT